ncbi:RraA family protein [Sphingobium aquiterrae]|uniref:RraA family protein n=1 Tax=Sphingobium aquiterrae TaxID=2038656 RepID=UPI00301ADD3C
MPQPLPQHVVALLAHVETATIGHVLHGGFLDPAIRAVNADARVAGTAVTVRIAGADSTLLHHAVSIARPGDILVIDRCGDTRHACWGGVTTNAAHLAGVAAIVIDGPATDFGEIRRVGLPVWCRGATPLTTKFLNLGGAMNVPVSVGGVTVCPGDAILADESGVVVLPPDMAEALARRAIAMQSAEIDILQRLRNGERLADISGASALIAGMM